MAIPGKIPVGQPLREFPGASFNALVDRYWSGRNQPQHGNSRGTSKVQGAAAEILLRNDSGADVQAGGVLILDGPAFTVDAYVPQVYTRPFMDGVAPAAGNISKRFAILSSKLADGQLGRGKILGACWARVNIITAGDTVCGPLAGDSAKLKSGVGETEILYAEKQDNSGNETGEQWGLILIGQSPPVAGEARIVKTTSAGVTAASEASGTLTYGSGTANPFDDQGDGTADIDTGTTFNVYNMIVGEAVDGNTICQAKKIEGLWFVDVEPC